ncbi:MAG: tetratricopeptide repeat protein [Limisphaerales bacterium]
MDNFEAAKQHFVKGLQLFEANDLQGAEIQFTQSLAILPDRVSTLNNLSAVKLKLEKFAEAEALALKAIAAGDKSPEAWANLGIARTATHRHEEALQAYARALQCNSAYARAWLNKAMTLLELKRYEEALEACNQALKLNSSQYEILYAKSRALKELGRLDEARKTYLTSFEMRAISSPLFIAERRATQKADILVISHNPGMDDTLKSFEELQIRCPNYAGQLADVFQNEFHFNFIFEGDATRSSARQKIPRPDLVINNCGNGDVLLSRGFLPDLTGLIDGFGVPVVNHPSKALRTTRDATAAALADVPGVLAPKTARFDSTGKTPEDMAREIEGQYDYPLITRTVDLQEGRGMTKVDSREALMAVFSAGLPKKFFVTAFVDSRGEREFYRKVRAAAIGDQIIISRVDFDSYWNVRGRKAARRVPFYLEHQFLLDEEKRICKDPEAELGRSAIQALRAIRDRIPLDVFGIDFDVGPDGVVIFYEGNAAMNLLTTAHKEVPNPKEPEECLKLTFHRHLTSLAARS